MLSIPAGLIPCLHHKPNFLNTSEMGPAESSSPKWSLDLGALQLANGLPSACVYGTDSVHNGSALPPFLPEELCAVLPAETRPEVLHGWHDQGQSTGYGPA